MAEAKSRSPFELVMELEGARYRVMQTEDATMYGAAAIIRAWLGKKAPKFEQLIGRRTAEHFKDDALGRVRQKKKRLAKQITDLDAKIKERDNEQRRRTGGTKGHPRG